MFGSATGAPESDIVPAQAIHQERRFPAAPARVYEALLDSHQFAVFSKDTQARIDRSPGGVFSLFGGVITGRNIELVADVRIVQAWRNNIAWPPGLYSLVWFTLRPIESGTLLILDHTGFPSDKGEAQSLVRGWEDHYWAPLRRYFA